MEDFDSVARTKSSKKPRVIMRLARNPHMPHYRWHLTCLTNNGVIRQFSTHLSQPVDPNIAPIKSTLPFLSCLRVLVVEAAGTAPASSSVFNSYHQIVLYIVPHLSGFVNTF